MIQGPWIYYILQDFTWGFIDRKDNLVHLTQVLKARGMCHAEGNGNLSTHHSNYFNYPQKPNKALQLLYHPSLPLLHVHWKNFKSQHKHLLIRLLWHCSQLASIETALGVCQYVNGEAHEVCIHNWVLFSHEEEWNDDICRNIDWNKDYYSKWNEPNSKSTVF